MLTRPDETAPLSSSDTITRTREKESRVNVAPFSADGNEAYAPRIFRVSVCVASVTEPSMNKTCMSQRGFFLSFFLSLLGPNDSLLLVHVLSKFAHEFKSENRSLDLSWPHRLDGNTQRQVLEWIDCGPIWLGHIHVSSIQDSKSHNQ